MLSNVAFVILCFLDSFTDAEFNPVPVVNDTDTGLADQGVSESGAGVSPAETSQSQALCESVSTKPTDPKYAASSTRRAFSMVELTTQGIAEQGYIKTLQLLGTLFPNLKPEKEDHKDVETEFVTNETVSIFFQLGYIQNFICSLLEDSAYENFQSSSRSFKWETTNYFFSGCQQYIENQTCKC